LGANISFLKSLDPVVLFGSLSYQRTDSRNFEDVSRLEPATTTVLSLGYAFALNDRLSLNSWIQTSVYSETRFEDAVLRENDFTSLQFGITARVAGGLYLQPNVGIGLNGIGSAFSVGLNIPMTFRRGEGP
jgi:hypothetical protein